MSATFRGDGTTVVIADPGAGVRAPPEGDEIDGGDHRADEDENEQSGHPGISE
jgi:hypothetical protein